MIEQIRERRNQYAVQLTQCRAGLAELKQQECALLGAMAALEEILADPENYGKALSAEKKAEIPAV